MLKLILPQQAIHRQVFNNANPFLYLSLFALVESRFQHMKRRYFFFQIDVKEITIISQFTEKIPPIS